MDVTRFDGVRVPASDYCPVWLEDLADDVTIEGFFWGVSNRPGRPRILPSSSASGQTWGATAAHRLWAAVGAHPWPPGAVRHRSRPSPARSGKCQHQ